MAPIKRVKPAFSPPRPKKSRTALTPSTSNTSKRRNTNRLAGTKSAAKKPTNRGQKRARIESESGEDEDEDGDYGDRSALALVDMQVGEDDDDDDEEEEEEEEEEGDSSEEDNPGDAVRSVSSASEEPDMILAEITENDEPPSEALPEALVHKMLQHHFEKPQKTKLSSDARSLMTKYLEIFVREAIMRSSYERQQREHDGDDEGGGAGGFLEVEDLERAAVQLCLDF